MVAIEVELPEITRSDFVRSKLLGKLVSFLRQRQSVRLIALPRMGVSTVLRELHAHFSARSGLGEAFQSFYLCNRYDLKSVRRQLRTGLKAAGVKRPSLRSDHLGELCLEVRDNVRRDRPKCRVIFIFDDFGRNLVSYDPASTLNEKNITDMRNLAERDEGIHFVVNYRHPIDHMLGEDWYLNNFQSVEVGFLSEDEARSLVQYRRQALGFPIDEKTLGRALELGGRHPFHLDGVAALSAPDGQDDCDEWLERRYQGIFTYILKWDQELKVSTGTLEVLKEVATQPKLHSELFPQHTFAARYCLKRRNDDGRDSYSVFSRHFGSYLIGRTESLIVMPSEKRALARDLLASIGLVALSFLLIPPLFGLVSWISGPLFERVLFVSEFDSMPFRWGYLRLLWIDRGLLELLTPILVSVLGWGLFHVVLKRGQRVRLWRCRLGANNSGGGLERLAGSLASAAVYLGCAVILISISTFVFLLQRSVEVSGGAERMDVVTALCHKRLGSELVESEMRELWFHQSAIRPAIQQEGYLLITPLVMGLEGNFPSAIRTSENLLVAVWTRFLDLDEQPSRPDKVLVRNRFEELMDTQGEVEVMLLYRQRWKRDQASSNHRPILDAARKQYTVGVERLDLALSALPDPAAPSADLPVFFYGNLRAAVMAKQAGGDGRFLQLVLEQAAFVFEPP